MPQTVLDDADVRVAMRAYLTAADRLAAAAEIGAEARTLLDAAEAKTIAGLRLRKALERHGWTAPAPNGAPAPA